MQFQTSILLLSTNCTVNIVLTQLGRMVKVGIQSRHAMDYACCTDVSVFIANLAFAPVVGSAANISCRTLATHLRRR